MAQDNRHVNLQYVFRFFNILRVEPNALAFQEGIKQLSL